MSEVWRGSTSAEMWAEIEALRRSNAAHVDTIMAAVARAEAAEAKLDEQIEAAIALRHDLDTLRDLYGAAEARIAAALEWLRGTHPARVSYALAALVEPVGEPPRPGDPRFACVDCHDTGLVPVSGRGTDGYEQCACRREEPPLHDDSAHAAPTPTRRRNVSDCIVPRDLLIDIDSVCSLVAHRGLDDEAKAELRRVSLRARAIYESVPPESETP